MCRAATFGHLSEVGMPSPSLRVPLTLAIGLCGICAFAQQNDVPLNRDIYDGIDRNGVLPGSTMHTGLRPLIESRADLHGVMGYAADSTPQYYWITEKLFKEHLVKVVEGDLRLTVDPVFQFEVGKEFRERTPFADDHFMQHNGRGFHIMADLGPTVSFQSDFYENQAILPGYLYDYAQTHGVVPGQGRIKGFNQRGLDFAWASGNVSWSPKPWINAQLGQGRHFVGNGYRSVLLSDNSAPYPYVKLSALTGNKRLQYSVIFAKLRMVAERNRLPTGEAGESLFYWKRATFAHLGLNLGPAQLGLFEGTLWRTIDSAGVRAFDARQLNPVIGLNTAIDGFHGDNTVLPGMDVKVRLAGKGMVYGQFALWDPQERSFAWQLGAQWFDLFLPGLHLLAEYDHATPFAYMRPEANMGWTHYGQPLASPLGTGYSEALAIVDLPLAKKLVARTEVSFAHVVRGTGRPGLSGADVLWSTDPGIAPDGELQRVYFDLSASWRMNPMTNMQVTVGYSNRDLQPAPDGLCSGYFHVAFHTGLFNRYYDL